MVAAIGAVGEAKSNSSGVGVKEGKSKELDRESVPRGS